MDPYVRTLLDLPPLDAETERRLARRAATGDARARQQLIESGLRLVAMHALRLGARGEALRDAVQAGTIGLIEAVDRFDPDRGARLATYAWPWVGHAVAAALRDAAGHSVVATVGADGTSDWVVEEVDALDDRLSDVLRMRHRLDGSSGPPRSREHVAVRLGLTVSQVRTREAEAMRQLRGRLARIVHRAPLHGGADPP